ncbi:MAG: 4-phosphoerythronate dehydrogenase [Bacteroidetes bacterium]|nr:4-phosphoerythronate dehydrogenase [Bacteroidota bacterium]
MISVIIDSAIPFTEGVLDDFAIVKRLKGKDICPKDIAQADALIIRTRTKCNEALLKNSKVKFIGSATIGFDHIDLDYCRQNGIIVQTAAGCNAMAVAHYMASVFKKIEQHTKRSIKDMTIGIIGVGNVGGKIATLAEKTGMKVLTNDPPVALKDKSFKNTDIKTLLKESDIVTLHVPHTKEGKFATTSMVNKDFVKSLKKGAIFINASRGEIVVDEDLIEGINNKTISYAVIDVWNKEPNINKTLLNLATIVTPHIAGYSIQGKANGTSAVINSLAEYFNIDSLKKWYPEIKHKKSDILSGKEILEQIDQNYDVSTDDKKLRENPELFEELRNKYDYRDEYFSM